MIGAWMAYCLAVGVLLGVGAAALERVLRAYGWPGRWAWAGAVAGTICAPVMAWLAGAEPVGEGAGGGIVLGSAEVVASGLSFPVALVPDPVFDQVLYVVERGGLVRVIHNGQVQPTPFADFRSEVSTEDDRRVADLREHGLERRGIPVDVVEGRYETATRTADRRWSPERRCRPRRSPASARAVARGRA